MKVKERFEFLFDLHHRDPEQKLYNISDCPLEHLDAEMKKCDLMCAVCHKMHTRKHNDGRNANAALLKKLRESGDLPRAPGKLETNVDVVESTAAPAQTHHPYNNQFDLSSMMADADPW